VIKTELKEGINVVTYTYEDVYGNTVTDSVVVFLDLTPPVVVIRNPEPGFYTDDVVIPVEWTVDGVVMDQLNIQSLDAGRNYIVRTYRDKAGNEGSDTTWVYLRATKSIALELEQDLLKMDEQTIEKFYADNPPADDEFFSVSVYNNETGKEEQLIYGKGGITHPGDSSEPYVGMSGKHLGPTLVVNVRLPEIGGLDATGAQRGGSLKSIVEADGRIAITSCAGDNRVMVNSVDEYVKDHCLADAFQGLSGDDLLNAPLFRSKISLDVQVYDVTGQFVDQMDVVQDITRASYLNDAGMVKLYFEIKPTREHGLQSVTGRKYGDGAYLMQATVKSRSVRLCDMPDGPKGQVLSNKENVLSKFGYKRD